MVVNNATFGELVSRARRDRTQEQMASRGGPPRQRLSQIESGDPVELTSGVLSQLDTAFLWGTGTSELLLTPVHRPPNLVPKISALDQTTALGVTAGGELVAMPKLLEVDHLTAMLPLITRWPGPVLIDIGLGTEKSRVARLSQWLSNAGDIDTNRLRRTGLDGPHSAEPIAIDPFNDVRTTNSAAELLARIDSFGGYGSSRTSGEYRDMAPTVLFIASQTTQQDGLSILSRLRAQAPADGNMAEAWRRFFAATGLSSRLQCIDHDVLRMLNPLLTLKDFHSELVIADDFSVQRRGDVTVVRPADLAGTIVFYDAQTCPFLPVLIDHAYAGKPLAPLVLTDSLSGWRAPETAAALPNSHLVVPVGDDWHNDHGGARAFDAAQLIDRREGSAILIPGQQDRATGAQSQRVWFSTRGRSESNLHLAGDESTSDGPVEYFRSRRGDFGMFDKAEWKRSPADGDLTIALTDEHGARLLLNSIPDTWISPQAATILTEAGFEVSTVKTMLKRGRAPMTLIRPAKPTVLRLGTATTGGSATINLQHGHAAIAGDKEAIIWVLPQAIRNRRQALPITDLAILGATTEAARPWVDVAGERALGFVGPGIGARDAAAVTRWLVTELTGEMSRRTEVLSMADVPTAKQYRAAGGAMPPLMVIIDGLDGNDEHWLDATDLLHAADNADRLNIRFLLSGTNPVPLMTLLETRSPEGTDVPRFTSKVAFPGAQPEITQHLIGLPAGLDASVDGHLWTIGCAEPMTFRIDE